MKGILIYIMRVLRLIGLPPQKAFPKQAFSGPGSLPKFWFVVASFGNNFLLYQCSLFRNEKLYKRGIESMVPQLKANASAIDLLKNVCGQNVIIVRFNSFFFCSEFYGSIQARDSVVYFMLHGVFLSTCL